MKIRTDFVTNSSSACYIIDFQLKSDRDMEASFRVTTEDMGTEYRVCGTGEKPTLSDWHAKSLGLRIPSQGDAEVFLNARPLSKIESLEELIEQMLSLADAQLYRGGYSYGAHFMPGAVQALADRCAQQGITRDNLRIIGGKIGVHPWGDSLYEVSEYIDQWCVNVQEGELRHTGKVYWRRGGTPNWKPGWQDSDWWPFTGVPYGVPYESVVSGAVKRHTVRHVDLSSLDSQWATSARSMFENFDELQELDLSGLDTSQVTDMSRMFCECRSLRELDLSGLDTSRVADMSRMFSWCKSLCELDLSGFDTSQVTDMGSMFENCWKLEVLDVSSLDTSKVADMQRMFHGCVQLKRLDLSGFDTSHVTDMSNLFSSCEELVDLNLSGLDTSHVTNMGHMFSNCESLRSLDLSGFDTSQVTDMCYMFNGCKILRNLDLSGFGPSQVTDMTMMFCDCKKLESIDLSKFDASRVKKMRDAFKGCKSLRKLSVSDTWPVEISGAIPKPKYNDAWWSEREGAWLSVDSIRERGRVADTFTATRPVTEGLPEKFVGAGVQRADAVPYSQVASGDVDRTKVRFIDVSGVDTLMMKSMSGMFEGCTTITKIDLTCLDTSRIKDMSGMFAGCTNLRAADLSGLDTSRVKDMSGMFAGCTNLRVVNLSGLDTSRVRNMSGMFDGCHWLREVNLSGFDTSRVRDMSGCSASAGASCSSTSPASTPHGSRT